MITYARLSFAVALLFCALSINNADALELANSVKRETIVSTPAGSRVDLVDASRVSPGDILVLSLDVHNDGAASADRLVIDNPVPTELQFLAVSEGPAAEYSVDGGQNFGPLARLIVRETDGTPRPATPADVTHVRWRLREALAPGARRSLSFRAQVR